MFKKGINKINMSLILPIILLVSFIVSSSSAYWLYVLGAEDTSNQSAQIGEWGIKVHLMPNLSDDFEYEEIIIPKATAFTEALFLAKFPLNPNPKTHDDIDHSEYEFDNWYKSDGTLFDYNEILVDDIYVYPSWNSKTFFNYSLGSTSVTLNKNPSATFSGNLYIPGWRYKGREITQLNRNFDGISINKLTIGEGIKKLVYGAFRLSSINSLVLEEGLEIIEHSVFQNVGLTGSLVFPSTIKEINSNSFNNNNFDGILDLSQANDLTLIGQSAFSYNNFIGNLKLGSSLKTIGTDAFRNTTFNGTLDLTEAISLETINERGFYGAPFTGGLYIPPNLSLIQNNAFDGNNFDGTLDLTDAIALDRISSNAFKGANFIGDLDMSNTSLTFLGQSVFLNTGFTGNLIMAPTIETIQSHAFTNTGFTGNLDFSNVTNLEIINASVFQNVPFTGTLSLPDSVTSISQTAFEGTKFTGQLDLSYLVNLTYIGTGAFKDVKFTETLVIPENLVTIDANSFRSTAITKLDLSNALSLKTIGTTAFTASAIEEIIFNYSASVLETIGTSAFTGNNITGYVALPQGIITINSQSFDSNSKMTGIYIPSTVTYLGNKIIGNKLPFTFDVQSLTPGPDWSNSWYYEGPNGQNGQITNFGVNPPY